MVGYGGVCGNTVTLIFVNSVLMHLLTKILQQLLTLCSFLGGQTDCS